MSKHPDFNDTNFDELEDGLRRKRPLTDPPREAFKHRLRADLMERIEMEEKKRFGLGQLMSLAGAAVLVVAIPLFFWLSLRPQFQAASPAAASPTETPAAIDPPPTLVPEPYPAADNTEAQSAPDSENLPAYPGPQPTAVPTIIPTATPILLAEPTVSIISFSQLRPHDLDGELSPFKQVDVQLAYTLHSHSEGIIVLAWQSGDGAFQGRDQIGILAGEGETTITLLVSPDKITADNQLRDDLVFTPHLWGYHASLGHYVHLSPPDAPAPIDPPMQPYHLGIHQFGYDEAAGLLNLALNYQLDLAQEVSATVSLLDDETTVISQTVPLTQGGHQAAVTLPITDSALAEKPLTLVWQLDTAERPLSRNTLADVVLTTLNNLTPNSIDVLTTEVIEQDGNIFVTFLVAYNLSEPYTAGAFSTRSSFSVAGSGGGGGGGGGGQPLGLGTYARVHTTSFPAEALAAGQTWEDVLEISFELIGTTAAGEQSIIDSHINIPQN